MKITITIDVPDDSAVTVNPPSAKPRVLANGEYDSINDVPVGFSAFTVPWALYLIDGAWYLKGVMGAKDHQSGTLELGFVRTPFGVQISRTMMNRYAKDKEETSLHEKLLTAWQMIPITINERW